MRRSAERCRRVHRPHRPRQLIGDRLERWRAPVRALLSPKRPRGCRPCLGSPMPPHRRPCRPSPSERRSAGREVGGEVGGDRYLTSSPPSRTVAGQLCDLVDRVNPARPPGHRRAWPVSERRIDDHADTWRRPGGAARRERSPPSGAIGSVSLSPRGAASGSCPSP